MSETTTGDDTVTITVAIADAFAVAMGPLGYTTAASAGDVPAGGHPINVRQEFAKALAVARPDICDWEARP